MNLLSRAGKDRRSERHGNASGNMGWTFPLLREIVRVTCVIASEIDTPVGIKPIAWHLVTNRKALTLKSALELIDWYRCCWEIETLFHVLKNGRRVEALQLDSQAKLELALALYLVVS